MPDYGALSIAIRANTSQLKSDISSATSSIGDDASRSIGAKLTSGIGGAVAGLGKAAGFAAIGAGAYGAAKAVQFSKNAVIDFNSTLQQSTIAFTTMLGSGAKARQFVGDLQTFAAKTPFEFQGLVQNAQSMMGMGVAAKDVLPDLTALGDSVASVGGGASVLDNTISAFGQTMAKGTLDMGNMNQLLQGGIPNALKVLAAHYKVTTGEMVKMISSGKVQSSEALPALVAGIEKGTTATAALGGMMDKQSKTMQGSLSNISDSLTQAVAKIGKPLFDAISGVAGRFATFLSSPAFQHAAKIATTVLGGWMVKLGPVLKALLPTLQHLFRQLWKVLQPVLGVFHDLMPIIVNVAKAIGRNLGAIFTQLQPIIAAVMPLLAKLGDILGKALVDALDALLPLWKPLGDFVRSLLPALSGGLGVLAGALKVVKPLLGALVDTVKVFTSGPLKYVTYGVLALVAAMKVWAIITGVVDAVMAANPVTVVAIAVGVLVVAIVELIKHWHTVVALFRTAWRVIRTAWDNAIDWLGKIPGVLKSLGGKAIDWLKGGITRAVYGIGSWVWNTVVGPVLDWFGKLPDRLMTLASNAIEGFKRGIVQIASGIGQWAWDHVIAPIMDFFGHLYDLATSYGGSLIRGLKDGIINVVKDIGGWINDNLVQPIIGAVKSFFGIKSPSTVMAGLGKSVIQGFLKGLFTKFPLDIAKTLFGSLPKALAAIVKKGLAVLTRLPVAAWHALAGVGGAIKGLFGGSTALTNELLAKMPPDVRAKLGLGAVSGNFGGSPQGVWSALLAAGFSQVQAAGIMGNIQTESGFNPNIVQGGGNSLDPASAGGGGYGLVQWTPGSKLIPYLHGETPTVANEISALVAQLRGEGPSPESAAGAALRGARNPYEAGLIFGLQYERFSTSTAYSRAAQADEWYRRFANGHGKYDGGGLLPVGASIAVNTSHRPEPVLTGGQWDALTGSAQRGHGPLVVTGGRLLVEPDEQGRLRGWVQDIVMEEADLANLAAQRGRGSW